VTVDLVMRALDIDHDATISRPEAELARSKRRSTS
jgi:hypothetical protein